MPKTTPLQQTPSSSTVFHHHQPDTMFLYLSSILAPLLLLFFFLFYTTLLNHKQTKKLPPGSFGWLPFLGQTLSFLTPHPSTSIGNFLDHSVKRYGKIFRSHLFGEPSIVSCDGDFNSFVLQNEGRLFQSYYPEPFRKILGPTNMLVTNGDNHKRLRAVAVNYLGSIKDQNSTLFSDIEDNALFVMGSWRNKSTIHFCEQARKFTFYVIAKQVVSLGPEDPRTTFFFDSFRTFMKGLISLPLNFPGTPYARALQASQRIIGIAREILHDRQKESYANKKLDFLDAMMMHDELHEEEIVNLVLGLLLGAHETTTMLIAIIVRFLADNPKALQELREEHEWVRRKKGSNKRLGLDDFVDMTFTHDLIKESLRCGNIVKFIHRKTIKPIYYNGFEIPMGWKVLPVFTAIHLDPTIYSDPLEFNPWRWQSKEMKDMGGNKYFMAFGGGKRLCPGAELAKVETAFFLHHLVLNFEWTPLKATEQPMAFPYVEFEHGLQLSIHPLPNSMFANTP